MATRKVVMFFDDFPLDEYRNVRRRFVKPALEGVFEGPDGFVTVEYLKETGTYRMWCRRWADQEKAIMSLAESDNAKEWRFVGDVFTGDLTADEFHVFIDERDPGTPYKMAYTDGGRPAFASSCNGIRWKKHHNIVWHPTSRMSDTQNHLIFNPYTSRYQIFCRKCFVDRRVALVESPDLVNWTEPRIVLHPDPLDVPCVQFYGMPAFYYAGMFIGFLWVFYADMSERRKPVFAGPVETELTYSYDGLTWNRTHHPLFPTPALGEWGSGSLYGSDLFFDPVTEKLRIYAAARRQEHHHYEFPISAAVLVYGLRKDGFVCLESMGREGYIRTIPFLLESGPVTFNIKAPLGRVSIQISDAQCNPIPGFTFDEFGTWTGDSTDFEPKWKEKTLNLLQGKEVRFEIKMEQAQLYSIRGDLKPYHAREILDWF